MFWHITLGSFSTIAYYVVFLLFSSCMAFFLIKSLEKEMGMSTGGEASHCRWLAICCTALPPLNLQAFQQQIQTSSPILDPPAPRNPLYPAL